MIIIINNKQIEIASNLHVDHAEIDPTQQAPHLDLVRLFLCRSNPPPRAFYKSPMF